MKDKINELIKKYIPNWAILPLLSIVVFNCLIYWGSSAVTAAKYHHDFTTALDRAVPLVPGFVWIYILAFPFWAVNYLLAAQRGKDRFYRFVATDLTVHFACLVIFLLIPTTNIRPEITGNSLSEAALRAVYLMDGGKNPSNLLPSIHCYVSWLCWRGLKGAKEIPEKYQHFSLVFAVLVIISTQVLKQHYLVDAVLAVALVEVSWNWFEKGEHHLALRQMYERLDDTIRNRKWNRNKKEIGESL